MTTPTIAIIAAGAMGAGVASKLVQAGCKVLTNLDGRSDASRTRATDAGMIDATCAVIAEQAQFILSILPPSDAVAFAERFAKVARSVDCSATFADCNAVNPVTVKKIAALFHGSKMAFIDAGIVGDPPTETKDPVFYASADDEEALKSFHGLTKFGMRIALLEGEGAGIGNASALKMSYAGIAKGTTGLMSAMILAAHGSSPATAQALLNELGQSQPQLLSRIKSAIPPMLPKAYRWAGEMEEIAGFVGEGEGEIYKGISKLYSRIETSIREGNDDAKVLGEFVVQAKKL